MRRRGVHAAFALLAAATAAFTGTQALRLGQALRLEEAVRSAAEAPVTAA